MSHNPLKRLMEFGEMRLTDYENERHRGTARPIYTVQTEHEINGIDPDFYDDVHFFIADWNGEEVDLEDVPDEVREAVQDSHVGIVYSGDDLYEVVASTKEWRMVELCVTSQGMSDAVLKRPWEGDRRTYVQSAKSSSEMGELMKTLEDFASMDRVQIVNAIIFLASQLDIIE